MSLCPETVVVVPPGHAVEVLAPRDQEDVMRGIMGRLSASALVGFVLLATAVAADEKKTEKKEEEKLTLDKLPPKVQEVIKARFPGAEFTSITKETEGGKVVYDIEMKFKGKKAEMDIREDGSIVNIEKEIEAKDLPAAVTKALEEKYPKSKFLEVMAIYTEGKEDKLEGYEVTLETAEKKKIEVEVSPDGKTIKEGG
jgi:uncharacterized membrane protein YkoI